LFSFSRSNGEDVHSFSTDSKHSVKGDFTENKKKIRLKLGKGFQQENFTHFFF
jgi:hypothetical protein